MKCLSCSAECAPDARFCAACGAALIRGCSACRNPLAAGARFCSMCGAAQPAAAPAAAASPPSASEGERRQLTVLFADVVGATLLSGRVDPEALRGLLREYQQICVDSTVKFGGTVHQYAGDGVLAYFGYPAAHDNDAERAVRAGLAIVDGVRRLTEARRARGEADISARVGIHTGLVVVGEMGAGAAREVHAIGETPNLAARIQSEAAPDTVCISAATAQLAGGRFQLRSMGVRPMKGIARDVELFAVEGTRAAFPAQEAPALAPLFGRETELGQLLGNWQQVRMGRGQAVLISGEGGIGKSRLLAEFRARAEAQPGAWRNIFCSPFYQNSALQPMIDLVDRAVSRDAEGVAGRAGALRRQMQDSGVGGEMTFALIASLLGIEGEHDRLLRDLAPDQRRRRTLDTLVAWLLADAQRHPLVVVVEDLHWVDASTRDLLGMLLERIPGVPILAVFTFRPEFVPTWTLQGRISMMALTRLAPAHIEGVVLNATGGKALPARVLDEVVRRTDGVPLFVEELTKAIVAAGIVEERGGALEIAAGRAALLEIPATLRDSLTARLDRLGPAKALAQLAAVIGREFDYPVLQAVCDLPEAEMESRLDTLNRAEILQQRGVPPHSHYIFKHALIQQAAYDTLLIAARQQHHRRVAQAYEQRFTDIAQSRPEVVAQHYSRALMPEAAVAHWQRAGELAVARSGYNEALGHLGAALEQLELLPESPARSLTELALRVKIGPALQALKGLSAAETGGNYERACRLAEGAGDSPERFMALWGDWIFKTTSGAIEAASRRSEDLVSLSRRLGKDDYVLQAHHSRWTNYFVLGNAAVARADTLKGIEIYDRERHREHKHLYGGHDPGVCAHGVGANAAWLTGHVGEAQRLARSVVAVGEALDHPFSLCLAHIWAGCVFWIAEQHDMMHASGESLAALCEKYGFRQWSGNANLLLGAAHAARGDVAVGLKLVEEGVEQARSGGPMWVPMLSLLAARTHLRAGNAARAIELLSSAIELARKLSARWFLPEMERLRAETLFAAGTIDEREAGFRFEEATRLAAEQSAPVLEWRARLSHARLHLGRRRPDEARTHLEAICSAGTKGVDASELHEAQQLLSEAS